MLKIKKVQQVNWLSERQNSQKEKNYKKINNIDFIYIFFILKYRDYILILLTASLYQVFPFNNTFDRILKHLTSTVCMNYAKECISRDEGLNQRQIIKLRPPTL